MRTTPSRRASPWSKQTDALVRYVAGGCPPSLKVELGQWLESSSRFAEFVARHRDKIRKKLRTSSGYDARMDVRAELMVAHLVLNDRRFELAFETYGSRQPGPDLSVTYRANQRLNLEVTRLRAPDDADAVRLASLIAAKVRQFPAEVPNALVVVVKAASITEQDLIESARLLKLRADARDDAWFAARGLLDARDFYAHYLRLAGVFVVDEDRTQESPLYVANRGARRPLPTEVIGRLRNV